VLAFSISFKRMQFVAGRCFQIGERVRGIDYGEFSAGNLRRSAGNPFGQSPLNTASVFWSLKLRIIAFEH
jgi:hypothetical protein